VVVVAETVRVIVAVPEALAIGVAFVLAYQAFPLILATGALAWGIDRLLGAQGRGRLVASVLFSCALAGLAVLWAEPEPGLVVIAVVAGATAGLVSQLGSWFQQNEWLMVLGGTVLASLLGLAL
jgi:uncharacterized membrane protein YjjB (DUF3815 family)